MGIESLQIDGSSTKVSYSRPYAGVTFPTVLLTRQPAYEKSRTHERAISGNRASSLAMKINHLLDANNQGILPGLNQIAAIAGISGRTLQRKLADEGTSFSAIVDRWRFRKAIELLADPRVLVKDIFNHLGYSDVSNFERAFRRWTNTTPGKYRDNLM